MDSRFQEIKIISQNNMVRIDYDFKDLEYFLDVIEKFAF